MSGGDGMYMYNWSVFLLLIIIYEDISVFVVSFVVLLVNRVIEYMFIVLVND